MSIEEKRRAAFEQTIRISHPDDYAEVGERIFKREGTGYDWHWVNEHWLCWNDALDSVVIELPGERIEPTGPSDRDIVGGIRQWNECIFNCKRYIESAGLKVKS